MATIPSHSSVLKRLICDAGYVYQTVDRRHVQLLFGGPCRPWTMTATLDEHWLNLWVYICAVPEAPSQRAELAEFLMQLNAENALGKYGFHNGAVVLELDYRHEHLSAESMNGVVGLLVSIANDDYPRIVRVLCGDTTLNRLEQSFRRS